MTMCWKQNIIDICEAILVKSRIKEGTKRRKIFIRAFKINLKIVNDLEMSMSYLRDNLSNELQKLFS